MAGGKSRMDDFKKLIDMGNQALEQMKEYESTAGKSKKEIGGISKELKEAARQAAILDAALKTLSMGTQKGLETAYGKDWKNNLKNVQDLIVSIKSASQVNEKAAKFFSGSKLDTQIEKINKAEKDYLRSLKEKEKAQDKSSKGDAKQTAELKKQSAMLKEVKKNTDDLTASLNRLAQASEKGGRIRVRVDNQGFQSVMTEMSKAIENFHKRAEKGDNFFDQQALRAKATPPSQELKQTAEGVAVQVGNAFNGTKIKELISKSVGDAIAEGVINGVKFGVQNSISQVGDMALYDNIAALTKKMEKAGASNSVIKHAISEVMNVKQPLSEDAEVKIQRAREKYQAEADARVRIEKASIREVEKTKRQEVERTKELELAKMRENLVAEERRQLISNDPKAASQMSKAMVQVEKYKAQAAEYETSRSKLLLDEQVQQAVLSTKYLDLQIQKMEEDLKKTRDWTSRKEAVKQDFERVDLEMQREAENLRGRELSDMDKALLKMSQLVEKRYEIEVQARDGVRNTATQRKNYQDMLEQIRVIAKENYRLQISYKDQNDALEKALRTYQQMDQRLQAIGNMVAGMVRAWNVVGSAVSNMFGRIHNQMTRMFYTGRTQITKLAKEAYDQFNKLELSQIGFQNFFGATEARKLIGQIQSAAIAAPALSAGDLASYVASLAPVSGGNADIALNATLGVLKAIQYSGGEAKQEMERVVANIRDVISKGKATTIDIRQFNRAMPAITKALDEMGASEFLKNGELNITPKNAKTLMEAFARLNTDADSPVRNIFTQMGNTMSALTEAFSERGTQMGMNILQNSGAFDLIKSILINTNESSIFTTVGTFLTDKLKAAIDWLKTIDWDKLGTSFRKGMEHIKNGFITARDTIASALPSDFDAWSALETIYSAIHNAIVGFANGVRTTVEVISRVLGNISPEMIEKAASLVGFMMSPIQKLFSTLGSFATSILSFSQNLNKTLSKFTQSRIDQFRRFADTMGTFYADATTTANKIVDLKDYKNISYNPANNTFTATNPVTNKAFTGMMIGNQIVDPKSYATMSFSSKVQQYLQSNGAKKALTVDKNGEISSYDYSNWDKFKASAQVIKSNVATVWQRTLNSFMTQIGKIVNGGQIVAFGASIQAMTDKTNKAAQVMGAALGAFGITSLGSGIGGSIFGALGNQRFGTIAGGILGAVVGIANTVNAWYEADRAEKAEAAKKRFTEAQNEYVENMRRTVMDALGLDENATESAAYVYEQITKRMNDASMKDLVGEGKFGSTMEEVLQNFADFAKAELNRYYRSDFLEEIDDFVSDKSNDLSERAKAFHAATGGKIYSNWGDDADADTIAVRKWIADFVRQHGLLADNEVGGNLQRATDQRIVEAFLSDMPNLAITGDQVEMLKHELEKAEKNFPSDMDKIHTDLVNNSDVQKVLSDNIGTLSGQVQKVIEEGINVTMNGGVLDVKDQTYASAAQQKSQGTGLWSDIFGGISTGYKTALQNGLFDEGTMGLFKDRSNTMRFTDLNEKLREKGVYDEIKNTKWFNRVGAYQGLDLISGLYEMLLRKADEYKANPTKLADIGRAYEILEEKSFVGLPAEQSIEQLAEIIKKLYELSGSSKWLFEARGGFLTNNMISGRGVDVIPTFLQPGEFVMRRGSVMKAGLNTMTALNRGDLTAAANSLGSKLITGGEISNTHTWNRITNNNQRTNNNVFNIVNRNMSARASTYAHLANRIATA